MERTFQQTLAVFIIFSFVSTWQAGAETIRTNFQSPFEISGKKVHIAFDEKGGGDMELAILVDEYCAAPQRILSPFFSQIKIKISDLVSVERRSPLQTHKFLLPRGGNWKKLLDVGEAEPCVKGISMNRRAFADQAVNDPYLERQTFLKEIDFLSAYKFFFDPLLGIQHSPVIAVIDTGIDLTHSDLKANLWVNEKELNGLSGVDDDGNGYADDVYGYNFPSEKGDPSHETANDHGTHVAGLAAAATQNNIGVASIAGSKAKIMVLNVFGRNWGTETIYIDRAIRYAADNGADIINISINGNGASDTTAAAMAYALNKGVMIVVSAGNSNVDIEKNFNFPASYANVYPGLIAVGAIDLQTKQKCDFSNFNSINVKIAAPGCDTSSSRSGIYSTRKENSYGYKSGTSMSAPIVAGALAVAYEYEKEHGTSNPSVVEMENLFLQSAEQLSTLVPFFHEGRILNLTNLVEQIQRKNH